MENNNEFNLSGRRVLIFIQRGWGLRVGHFLAKKLQAQGCTLAALTYKKSTHQSALNQTEVKYEMIINNDEVMEDPGKYLATDDYTLEQICSDLGIDSVWPIIGTLRWHVKSYRDAYYYGYKQNVSDEEIILYVKAVYKYVNKILDEFKPEVIIAPNFLELSHIFVNILAAKRGITMMAATDCKIQGKSIFSYSYLNDRGPFYDYVDGLNDKKFTSHNVPAAQKYIKEFRESFKVPKYSQRINKRYASWRGKIKRELKVFYDIFNYFKYGKVNALKNIGPSIDYRTPRIILRDHLAKRRYRRAADHFHYYPFNKLDKFVYFPLQFQPEATIDVMAARFNNQIETARQVAMSLPDDYTLAVKDHPAMLGMRSRSYLEKLSRTPNVKLIDYRIPTKDILQKTALIISPSSTTVAEAAFYNKPAIQLGDLGTTLKLPNVFWHNNLATLSGKIKEIIKLDLHTDEYERRLENYVAAAIDTGFDFDYVSAWEEGKGNLEELWPVYRREIINCLKP
ncbi:MAG: hypothetical protein HUU49_00690 [Candidatus Buchananbacteria bacterium]|nr:hypothetical protein [Candidatus Buchananbacteria bacterium]